MIHCVKSKHKKDVSVFKIWQIQDIYKAYKKLAELFLIKKMANYLKDIIALNVYIPRNRTSKYVQQKLTELEWEIGKIVIIIGNVTLLS